MAKIGGLYVLIDPAACRGRSPVEVARAALAGGASMLQWRDKARDKGEQLPDLRAIYRLCIDHDAILIVNDQEVDLRRLEHLLESGGYTALTSTLDVHAVAALHQQHGPVRPAAYDLGTGPLRLTGAPSGPLNRDSRKPCSSCGAPPTTAARPSTS